MCYLKLVGRKSQAGSSSTSLEAPELGSSSLKPVPPPKAREPGVLMSEQGRKQMSVPLK